MASPWKPYVDNNLVGTGHIDKAIIIGNADLAHHAYTDGFFMSPEEVTNIAAILEAKGDTENPVVAKALAEGIHVAGERYVAFNIRENHIYGRKGKAGVIIVQTGSIFMVAQYGEDKVAANATLVVESIANYLIENEKTK